LVFWLLVLLLHVGFQVPLASPVESLEGLAENAGWLIALPAMTVVLGAGHPAIRRVLARVLRDAGLRDLPYVALFGESQAFTERAGLLPILSRRPPPLPAH
jgi:hypothetical protein